MTGRPLIIALLIAAVFRHAVPFVDLYFLLFLVTMFRKPDNVLTLLRYFLLGTFFVSFISGLAIGLLPFVTTLVFLILHLFQLHKSHKGLPTIMLWFSVYIAISLLESSLFGYFATGVWFVPLLTIQTILATAILSIIMTALPLFQKKL